MNSASIGANAQQIITIACYVILDEIHGCTSLCQQAEVSWSQIVAHNFDWVHLRVRHLLAASMSHNKNGMEIRFCRPWNEQFWVGNTT